MTLRNALCWTVTAAALATQTLTAASYYTERLNDPHAVYLTPEEFGVKGDGIADDTAAIQKAINKVVEKTTRGILFVPEGKYRVSKTIEIWPGIRVIGYGKTRPVFVLGEKTPGYQGEPAYMFHFAGNIPGHRGNGAGFVFQPSGAPRPSIDFNEPVREANPGTFYSAMSNVDIVIEKGNPGAVAVRSTFAQHCFLAHMDFQIGDGLAGIHDGGNFVENVRFVGGKFGIMTITPSPGWQYCLVDTSFEGQREAGIQSQVAGLTLIRPQFKNMPTAIAAVPGKGEQLWIKDGWMEKISGPAITISNEQSSRNQINIENVICNDVPVFASFLESGKNIEAGSIWSRVKRFSHGLHIEGPAIALDQFRTETRQEIEPMAVKDLPAPMPSAIPKLPPQDTWVNVRTLGVKGDGVADDTAALRDAIAKHPALYFPCGAYRISDTLKLNPDTALIGLHAGAVRIFIDDGTPAFQGVGTPVPMIEAPKGGTNILIGFGVYTNAINPRAVAVKWMAGENSLINDVRFLGGHGTAQLSGDPEPIYNDNHSGDPNPKRKWDSQYASLWVTDDGGGTFMDIWTPSPYAQAGILVSNTSTRGRIYEISSEHHVRYEAVFRNVSNWEIYALQLEEERGESGFALPVEVTNCTNLTFANLFTYRVISSYQPFPTAVQVANSSDIRFRNFHCWTNARCNFDNAIVDDTTGLELRQWEFAWMTLTKSKPKVAAPSTVLDGNVGKLADGFFRLAGGTADPSGNFYAVDARKQRIYRWTENNPVPELVTDAPHDAVNLATDKAGNLLVISYTGTVYAIDPTKPESVTTLQSQAVAPRPDSTAIVPQNFWTNGVDVVSGNAPKRAAHFVSPDGTTFLPAGEDFIKNKLSWGVRDQDILRAYGLQSVTPGKPFYITLERDGKTYATSVDDSGEIVSPKLFAEHGGEAVASDSEGNVYIAEGQIYVYDRTGKLLEIIAVPDRPLGLVFGGKDRKTLYIPAGTSLYSVRTKFPGN